MIQNPVLLKELKTKLRSRQSRSVRMSIGAVVGIFVLFCYYQALVYLSRYGDLDTRREWWTGGVVIQGIIIWLLCPALAANAVTQEKEQQTWEMLIFTLLSPLEILVGKLLSRLIPIIGILSAFFPLMFYCFATGGVTFYNYVVTYLIFACWILFLTTTSLFMSWAFRRTASAIAMGYLVLFALSIGTAMVELILNRANPTMDSPVIWLNPVRILIAMTSTTEPKAGSVLLFSTLTFLSITAFLFWRMTQRFRAFSIE